MNLCEYVANRIHELRKHYGIAGISQGVLAKAIGVTTNTISRWETGTYKPKLADLDKLSRFLGVSLLEFFPPEQHTMNEPVSALLRAVKNLPDDEVLEVQKYAEYRRARYLMDSERAHPGCPTIFSGSYHRNVLFSKPIEMQANTLRRWKPHITIAPTMTSEEDDD